jgi:hypothetical protein
MRTNSFTVSFHYLRFYRIKGNLMKGSLMKGNRTEGDMMQSNSFGWTDRQIRYSCAT